MVNGDDDGDDDTGVGVQCWSKIDVGFFFVLYLCSEKVENS